MYKDLAEAIEEAKTEGYDLLFEVAEGGLTTEKHNRTYSPEEVTIVSAFHFDQGTNPGDDRSLFLLKTDSGITGYLPTSYTTYRNREKAKVLDQLINDKGESN